MVLLFAGLFGFWYVIECGVVRRAVGLVAGLSGFVVLVFVSMAICGVSVVWLAMYVASRCGARGRGLPRLGASVFCGRCGGCVRGCLAFLAAGWGGVAVLWIHFVSVVGFDGRGVWGIEPFCFGGLFCLLWEGGCWGLAALCGASECVAWRLFCGLVYGLG